MSVCNPIIAFNDRTVTGRQFGIGDGTRLVWNLAGMDSDRAMLMPVLYKQDWGGIQALYGTARTNLCLQSQTLGTTWTSPNARILADSTTAPDGTLTADSVQEDSSGSAHRVSQSVTVGSATHTFSVYVKAGTRTWCLVVLDGSNSSYVNLATGAVGTVQGATPVITSVGNGWYRISISASVSGSLPLQVYLATGNGVITYAGDNTSLIYAWGAQLELGSVATPYIPTTTIAGVVTDYSVAATGVVTFATAPAAATALMYKEPHLPSVNVYRNFGVGDGSTVNFSLPFAPATPLIYKRDWAGNQLMYATSRTNNVIRSQEFNTTWSKADANVSINSDIAGTTAPDGTSTADELYEVNTNSSTKYVFETRSGMALAAHTLSVYAKAGVNRIWLALSIGGAGNSGYRTFNLSTGALGTATDGSSSSTITSVGNGWYRCTLTVTLGGAAPTNIIWISAGDNISSYAGVANNSIYLWGAQFESGSTATPYIPTTTALTTVTDYTLDAAGRGDVTFAAAPAAAAILSWTGTMGAQR